MADGVVVVVTTARDVAIADELDVEEIAIGIDVDEMLDSIDDVEEDVDLEDVEEVVFLCVLYRTLDELGSPCEVVLEALPFLAPAKGFFTVSSKAADGKFEHLLTAGGFFGGGTETPCEV